MTNKKTSAIAILAFVVAMMALGQIGIIGTVAGNFMQYINNSVLHDGNYAGANITDSQIYQNFTNVSQYNNYSSVYSLNISTGPPMYNYTTFIPGNNINLTQDDVDHTITVTVTNETLKLNQSQINDLSTTLSSKWNKTDNLNQTISIPASYTIPFTSSAASPVNNTTYYAGLSGGTWLNTNATLSRLYLPASGTFKKVSIIWNSGVTGSNEPIQMYLGVNNQSYYIIMNISDSSGFKIFSNTSMDVPVTAGDYINLKIICPTWATKPTNVVLSGIGYIE